MPNIPSIRIGKYVIYSGLNPVGEPVLWIQGDENNEGMETSIKQLEAVIDKYFKENMKWPVK